MRVSAHHCDDVAFLEFVVSQESNARRRDRYRAVLLALEGREAPVIAEMLGRPRSSIQNWVYAYRDHGLEGLRPKPKPGRPARLTSEQSLELCKHLDQQNDPLAFPEGNSPMPGRVIRDYIATTFDVQYSLAGIYRLLARLNFVSLRPRPVHPKNDPKAMADWLESAPLLSRR